MNADFSDELDILTAHDLFDTLNIDPKLTQLNQLVGLDAPYLDQLYHHAITDFAEVAQLAPASEGHHHARPGGLIEHTLDMVHIALTIRQGRKLPLGSTPEEQTQQAHRWTYAVFAGALLHDIGKLFTSFRLNVTDELGERSVWTPLHGPMRLCEQSRYCIEFCDSPYRHHTRMGLACLGLLPKPGIQWLAENPLLFHELCSYLSGQVFESGVIGEIVTAADRRSTARDLKVDAQRYQSTRVTGLGDRVIQAIRQILAEKSEKRNTPGAMVWTHEERTYLICRPLIMKVMQYLTDQGLTGVPQEYTRYYDLLLEYGYALPHPADETASIWSIKVTLDGSDFEQTFTVLAFESRRVFAPTRLPEDLPGTLEVVSSKDPAIERESVSMPCAEDSASDTQSVEVHDDRVVEPVPGSQPDDSNSIVFRSPAVADATAMSYSFDDNRYDIAEKFLEWVRDSIVHKQQPFNSVGALLHILPEGNVAVVTPIAFKRFCTDHGLDEDDFVRLQQRFARRKWNLKTPHTEQNVWPLWATGNNRTSKLNCWIITREHVFGDLKPPEHNKFITMKADPVEPSSS